MTKDLASRKHKELYKKEKKMGQDTVCRHLTDRKEIQMANKNLKIIFSINIF